MKKFVNISLILLLFGLSGSMSCESWPGFQQDESVESDQYDGLLADMVSESTTGDTTQAVSFFPEEQTPVAITSELYSVSEAGSSIVSRTYPWAECGIVQLDKIMPKEVAIDKPFDYTITITNLTDTKLTDIVISEDFTSNFKFISANPVAQEDTNRITWEIASLGPKATRQFRISGIAAYAEPLKQCTTVMTPVIPACADVEVIEPRLKLTKTAPSEVLLCDMIPVTFVVTNAGTGTVPGVRIEDNLPPGLRTTDGRSQIAFEAGSIGPGQSREFSIELRATKQGRYFSKAVASSSTGLRAESEETTTVVGLPVLSVSKSGPDRLYIGRSVAYEITVSNRSDVPARDTVVEETIPDGVTSVQASAGAKLSESKLIWDLGTLAPNSSETLRISYTPTKPGEMMNSVTATAYCAEPATALMKTLVTGIPAVMLEVVDAEDPIRVGSRATYVIKVTNQGSAIARNIRITCILEDNVRYVSSAGATAGSLVGDTVRFLSLGSLAPQNVAVWRVVVAAVKPGDVRFKVTMNSDDLTRPVEETESTNIYE